MRSMFVIVLNSLHSTIKSKKKIVLVTMGLRILPLNHTFEFTVLNTDRTGVSN